MIKKLVGQLFRSKTLSPFMKEFHLAITKVYRNIDGFDLCQRVGPVTKKLFETLKPILIPAEPLMGIS